MLFKSLGLSLLLHIFVFLFLVYWPKKDSPKIQEPIEISVLEKLKPSHHSFSASPKSHGHSPLPSIHSLAPQFQGSDTASKTGEEGDSLVDDIAAPWGSGGREFKRIMEYSLMNRIQSQTENLLYYPAVLAAHGIEGNVNVRLVLNKEGQCDWPKTEITSASPYLRVFVLDLMKSVCKQSYLREVRGRKLTLVDFSFQFAITENNAESVKKEKSKVLGNVLLFYRNSQKSIAQWHLGPFTGIFPLPLVNLDFPWLKEHWETYVEKKDPLAEFK
jgi:hypothetical protein